MRVIRILVVLTVVLNAVLFSYADAGRQSPVSIDMSQVIEVRFYANAIFSMDPGMPPSEIRNDTPHTYTPPPGFGLSPSFDPTYRFVVSDRRGGIETIKALVDWLELDKLHTYSLSPTDNVVVKSAERMMFVVDIVNRNGSVKSFYSDLDFLYDDTLRYRHLLDCNFMRRYFELVTFNNLDRFYEGQLELCKRKRADPNFERTAE